MKWCGPTKISGCCIIRPNNSEVQHEGAYHQCRRATQEYGDHKALGWRPVTDGRAQDYQWLTYKELDEAVTHAGSAMVNKMNACKGTCVGVYAVNSCEWMISMKAVDYFGGITV
jgi:long-subunit acyl-CoA synthetase (AMP-forming)